MNITNRTTHAVQQGTGPWLRLREGFFTASEAPAALGVSKYVTRAELLRRKYTGVAEEHSPATLGKFAAGHDAEARARPLAEAIAESEMFPVTMTAAVGGLKLLASLDGLTMDDNMAWETKLWNEELAAAVRAAPDGSALPEHYKVQMDQELLVTGASRCLFTCTDGTPERFVSCWYEASQERFAALLAGWRQFAADLAAYILPDAALPAPVGKTPDTLPALRIEVTGQVTASNLAEFKQTALATIRSVNRELRTDQDFADAEKAVKWCADVESRLRAAKEHALSQTASIDALFKALDDIGAEARTVRLDLDKLVTRRKTEVKEESVAAARRALDMHVAVVNAEIAPMALRLQPVDFAGAIKGLRSFASMQDALDTALAGAKIAADAAGRDIRKNLEHFQEVTTIGTHALFPDLGQLVHRAPEDFRELVQARVLAQQERDRKAEAERQAAEAQRIAAAEQRAREQEAARIAAQQAAELAAQRAESERLEKLAEENRQARDRIAADAARVAALVQSPPVLADKAVADANARAFVDRIDQAEPATLKLGIICERLGFTVSAAFLADALHMKPAKTDGASKLYTESQYQTLCRQLIAHVSAMAELYGAKVAA